ncbi:MAG TPA: twin-arginine translocation signal domain-containing protein, partial [Burkholderiales bacterium]|nr:twin-arginine translocation signal domain-containing protein [Burkholderiales bacterium]
MENTRLTRRDFIARSALAAAAIALPASFARAAATDAIGLAYPVGELEPVAAIRQRAEWKQFVILVWQWQNDVRKDGELYARA